MYVQQEYRVSQAAQPGPKVSAGNLFLHRSLYSSGGIENAYVVAKVANFLGIYTYVLAACVYGKGCTFVENELVKNWSHIF